MICSRCNRQDRLVQHHIIQKAAIFITIFGHRLEWPENLIYICYSCNLSSPCRTKSSILKKYNDLYLNFGDEHYDLRWKGSFSNYRQVRDQWAEDLFWKTLAEFRLTQGLHNSTVGTHM